MRTEYLTLLGAGEALYTEKKSRFIGTASPVATEAEAQSFIASARERFKDASHNVFAYSVGEGVPSKRCSDDGEPQGTGGVPVLDVIEKGGLQDTVIVVNRYFGGILLGAAGLIRAYGKSASLAVGAAGVVRLSLAAAMQVVVEYPLLGMVKHGIEKKGYQITGTKYGVDAELFVTVPDAEVDFFCAFITEITSDSAIVGQIGHNYIQCAQFH